MAAGVTRWSRAALLLAAVALVVWAGVRASAAGGSLTIALHLIGGLPWVQLSGLATLWLAGLCIHTLVLVAAMPGLTHRRALTLNLSGSAVSNVLPFGGVAGTALNLTMARSWGHSNLDFARFVVVSNATGIVAKLTLPLVAVTWLFASGALSPAATGRWWLPVAAAFAAGLVLLWALTGRLGPLLRVVSFGSHLFKKRGEGWHAAVKELLAGTDQVVRRSWARLTAGMAGYWLAQAALVWCCLLAVGLRPAASVVFAGLVAERVMTMLVITPGGAGGAEAGMVTVLMALGTDATRSLAGVLLFRAFVFAAEIPVGAVVIVCWWVARRRRWPERTSPPCA